MTTPKLNRSIQSQSQHLNEMAMPAVERVTNRRFLDTVRTFMSRTARVTVLSTASFIGGAGLVGPTAETASGGITLTVDDDPAARQRGEQRSGLYQGPGNGGSMHVLLEYDGLNRRETKFGGTAIAFNRYGLIATGHQFIDYIDRNLTIKVGTGSNYMTDPGTFYDIAELSIHPGYTGPDSRLTNADLAVLRYANPVPQSAEMLFSNTRPSPDSALTWGGYGQWGPLGGVLTADGHARAGRSFVSERAPAEGESSELYVRTRMFTVFRDELRPALGDSGSPLFDSNGLLTGMYTRAGLTSNSTYGLYLDLTRPEHQSFIQGHLSAVPEPSSLIVLGLGAGALIGRRVLTRR